MKLRFYLNFQLTSPVLWRCSEISKIWQEDFVNENFSWNDSGMKSKTEILTRWHFHEKNYSAYHVMRSIWEHRKWQTYKSKLPYNNWRSYDIIACNNKVTQPLGPRQFDKSLPTMGITHHNSWTKLRFCQP